jgi:hypothetical protein
LSLFARRAAILLPPADYAAANGLSVRDSSATPKADIKTQSRDVRFVPKGDMTLIAMRLASQMV